MILCDFIQETHNIRYCAILYRRAVSYDTVQFYTGETYHMILCDIIQERLII